LQGKRIGDPTDRERLLDHASLAKRSNRPGSRR
jgi:hypothetical protein